MSQLKIENIYSSDLCRAMQTAQILADELQLQVIPLAQFREVNNGDLAGMKNDIAQKQYPGMYWNQMGWEQNYPNGESPKQFYERIRAAWAAFSQKILLNNNNVILVTHGGVMHVIDALLKNKTYNNQAMQRKVNHAQIIALSYQNNAWKEIQ